MGQSRLGNVKSARGMPYFPLNFATNLCLFFCYLKTLEIQYFKELSYSKTCLKRPLKNRQNKALNNKW